MWNEVRYLRAALVVSNLYWWSLSSYIVRQYNDLQERINLMHELGEILTNKISENAPELFHDPDVQDFLVKYEFYKIKTNYNRKL